MGTPSTAPGVIAVPKLLSDGAAKMLNCSMIKNDRALLFLGEPRSLINRVPSSYAEAFDLYIRKLYVLYHDCAMSFIDRCLECCVDEAIRKRMKNHMVFVNKARAVENHSEDLSSERYIYVALRDYYFKDDKAFEKKYCNWRLFWKGASSDEWRTIVEKLTGDSDELYRILSDIAKGNISEDRTEMVRQTFKKEEVYRASFNYRALMQFSRSMKYKNMWFFKSFDKNSLDHQIELFCKQDMSDDEKASLKKEGKMTPEEMQDKLIKMVIGHLHDDSNFPDTPGSFKQYSYTVYELILQDTKMIIESQLKSS